MTTKAGFWERFDKNWDAINCARLIVRGDASLVNGISAYKLYIDGNVHHTPPRFAHLTPPNSVYTQLKAGIYRVVLREYEVKKPNRMESNTLYIEMSNDEQIEIQASFQNKHLVLSLLTSNYR